MTDIVTEIFKKYGWSAILCVIIIAFIIWGLAHWFASPGKEVSVLWGLVKYTKDSNKPISSTSDIKISLYNDISTMADTIGPIDNRHAPNHVLVKGIVSNATNYYVYVVVNDGIAEWIEPVSGLGSNVDGYFSCECYLGESENNNYLNKLYKVYATVTDREYHDYDKLDRKTILVKSNEIELFRTK